MDASPNLIAQIAHLIDPPRSATNISLVAPHVLLLRVHAHHLGLQNICPFRLLMAS
jgi:hypothetical protein